LPWSVSRRAFQQFLVRFGEDAFLDKESP